jgi:hypothetical protein
MKQTQNEMRMTPMNKNVVARGVLTRKASTTRTAQRRLAMAVLLLQALGSARGYFVASPALKSGIRRRQLLPVLGVDFNRREIR